MLVPAWQDDDRGDPEDAEETTELLSVIEAHSRTLVPIQASFAAHVAQVLLVFAASMTALAAVSWRGHADSGGEGIGRWFSVHSNESAEESLLLNVLDLLRSPSNTSEKSETSETSETSEKASDPPDPPDPSSFEADRSVWVQPCDPPTSFLGAENVITASSEFNGGSLAWHSRMNENGWAALSFDKHPWLEWNFGTLWSEGRGVYESEHPTWATVAKVRTRGRPYGQWMTKYSLEYTHDGIKWHTHPKEFVANVDRNSLVENDVDPPIVARALRLKAKAWHGAAAGRVDLIGCLHVDKNATVTSTTTKTTTYTTTPWPGCDAIRNASDSKLRRSNRSSEEMPSIFCWLVMMTHGDEVSLVRDQYKHDWGIFSCEGHMILSDGLEGVQVSSDESSRPIGLMSTGKGGWGSWVNAGVFLKAWNYILMDCSYLDHDWIVKVDPDTVFFPDRLKAHLQWDHTPWSGDDAWWLHNWNGGWYMIGAIEVMSRAAVERYGDRKKECLWMVDHGGGPCPGAEDSYIARCLNDQLGVERRIDTNCAQHMKGNQCWDHSKVAYHPFKQPALYEMCIKEATR